jgi:hypothetical protein
MVGNQWKLDSKTRDSTKYSNGTGASSFLTFRATLTYTRFRVKASETMSADKLDEGYDTTPK